MTTPAELRKLLEAATKGPWEAQIPAMTGKFPTAKIYPLKIQGRLYNFAMINTPDAELIAAMRNTLPKLLDVVEAAKGVNEDLLKAGFTLANEKLYKALAELENHDLRPNMDE